MRARPSVAKAARAGVGGGIVGHMGDSGGAARLSLARSAEAGYDRPDVLSEEGGRLTRRGREQALIVATRLRDQEVHAVYGSPMTRAQETAEILGSVLAVPVTTLPGLEEPWVGDLDGAGFERGRAVYQRWLAVLPTDVGDRRACWTWGDPRSGVGLSYGSQPHRRSSMSHRNAPLTPTGRLRLARCIVEQNWPLRRAADRYGVSITTAQRWAQRYREYGKDGMVDRSSRPHLCPTQLDRRTERRILGLRVSRRWGPQRIAYRLRLNPSTVHKVLRRYQAPPLAWTEPATGARLRARPTPRRYEHEAPGDLVHVDVKKLGRIPDGGGHRVHGRAKGNRVKGTARPGMACVHNAVDDHSRLAYSEVLPDERKETTAAFWKRANAYFTECGVTVKRVLTDNGSAYRSQVFAEALGEVVHKRTRPYRPQTNGKVERYNRTLDQEWAYAKPYASEAERVAALPAFLHTYNHHRGHTALKGASPASRVPNLRGDNT